jgi:hypothetical protein
LVSSSPPGYTCPVASSDFISKYRTNRYVGATPRKHWHCQDRDQSRRHRSAPVEGERGAGGRPGKGAPMPTVRLLRAACRWIGTCCLSRSRRLAARSRGAAVSRSANVPLMNPAYDEAGFRFGRFSGYSAAGDGTENGHLSWERRMRHASRPGSHRVPPRGACTPFLSALLTSTESHG